MTNGSRVLTAMCGCCCFLLRCCCFWTSGGKKERLRPTEKERGATLLRRRADERGMEAAKEFVDAHKKVLVTHKRQQRLWCVRANREIKYKIIFIGDKGAGKHFLACRITVCLAFQAHPQTVRAQHTRCKRAIHTGQEPGTAGAPLEDTAAAICLPHRTQAMPPFHEALTRL